MIAFGSAWMTLPLSGGASCQTRPGRHQSRGPCPWAATRGHEQLLTLGPARYRPALGQPEVHLWMRPQLREGDASGRPLTALVAHDAGWESEAHRLRRSTAERGASR